ncbi:MAG: alpha/beta hydrolase [Nocardioides marinisabuli]|uniref:alpha/beta fold hydrolase n=1 Tax=Nocardioides marinisabuli TaxID=419476 RepID=UPI003219280E
MEQRRTHSATTADGVDIRGTVRGHGPALVLLQGVIGDCDLDWDRTVDHLVDRFTCHLPSMRGRGLSGDHADLGLDRLIDDMVDYIESVGEATGLTGWSSGGSWALAATARSKAVSAAAPFEPGMLNQTDAADQALMGGAINRAADLVAAGDGAAAARAFATFPFYDQEIATAADGGYFEAAGGYVPHLLQVLQRAMASQDPTSDPAVLGAVDVPVAVLVGSATKPFFTRSAQYVVDHVPHARVEEIHGAAHAAPLTHPAALADALAGFFQTAQQPA